MTTEARIKELIKKRGTAKAKLTQFSAYLATAKSCDQLSDVQLSELDLRISKLDSLYDTYDTFQGELEVLVEDPGELFADRELFEGTYYRELATARELVERHRSQRPNDTGGAKSEVGSRDCPTVISYKPSNVRLPKIDLPHFSGGYQNWLEFKDIYKSLIHSEKSIDDINKFHYLRASLHGSAALVIRSLDFRADNYSSAWKLLCDRYDNKQLLVNNHVQALFNIESIHKESSQGLRQIVDNANKNIRALATLGQPVDHWDTLVIHIMSCKLDNITSRQWEEHRNSLAEPPSLDEFLTFLRNRCNLLETIEESRNNKYKTESSNNKSKSFIVSSSHDNVKNTVYKHCPLCKKLHYIFNCEVFRALPLEQRWAKAKELKVCLNCLRPGHNETKCNLSHCKYCKIRHNTLLHANNEAPATSEQVVLSANNHDMDVSPHVLLSTAVVKVSDGKGHFHTARILLDNGSTANFVTKDLAGKLSLATRSVTSRVTGINEQESKSTQSCSLHIESYDGTFKGDIDCFIIPKITSAIPNRFLNIDDIPIPSGICLADPYYHTPSSIDILVGAQVFWNVLGTKRIDLGKQNPTLFETKLGWLLSGVLNQPSLNKPVCFFLNDHQSGIDIDLTPFWELDTIPSKHNLTAEENACEETFINTTRRDDDGRFVVTLPLKESPDVLGDSFEMAKRRFLSLERKFSRDPVFKERYIAFMTEYESLGHMSESSHHPSLQSYYIPHHGVTRDSSTTTKLRAVFDASAASTSGRSLNDILLVGPRIQDDLFSILLRFRQHRFVVSADIEKMYRQILVDENQRSLQQIVWRSEPSQPLKIYTLNTLTYGTASASHLSTRCLYQLSQESLDKQTGDALAKDFYVDDFLSGSHTIADTVAMCRKVTDTLQSAKFNLRKWQSNSVEILTEIDNQGIQKDVVNLSEKELAKTLGINWHSRQDTLTFNINISVPSAVTKRNILSVIAQVFDPLGLVTPCIVEAKILMQRLWIDKCSWDEPLSGILLTSWKKFAETLPNLNNVTIPRWVLCESSSSVEFHVFSDSSEKSYGACLYTRSVARDGSVCVRLFASKSKIAPIKATTIPRLELCGALLGARLCKKVLESITFKPERCQFWCDSMIVIGWLKSHPSHLRPFVKNRVSEIQESFSQELWRYVPSKDNPADLVSRGLDADLIQNSSLWWSGPPFLASSSSCWPSAPSSERDIILPDTTKHKALVICPNSLVSDEFNAIQTLINNCSEYVKIQRIIAYMKRFIHNCKNINNKRNGFLTSSELSAASTLLLSASQQDAFSEEYKLLKLGKTLPRQSRLTSLCPFYDSGLIRVGGRLSNSFYDYGVKHPIIVCCKQPIIKLLFRMLHLRALHAGPQLLMTVIRQNYWALGGRNLVKNIVHKCVRCIRLRAETVQPVMGNLPKERVHLEYPFMETGTDYAGPILIADRKGRGCRLMKSYICIFVCLATRALHLELVSDLTKEAFIAALDRFIARRGKPRAIFSDNGTTFVGAANELANVLKQEVAKDKSVEGIHFSFIPAYTPHFGGLWESAVKSVKYHLRRILGLTHLTYEEMATCLSQIEAILNSRPLTPLSDDPTDLSPLTPAHFLIGRSLTLVPHLQVSNQNISSLQRFQRIEVLKQHFWSRFSNEYIFGLQQRTKWHSSKGKLEVGTMVVIKENNLPPLMWMMGRIVNVLPGRDGVARVADIKTRKGIIRRAFNTICPLPVHSFEDTKSSTPAGYGAPSTTSTT